MIRVVDHSDEFTRDLLAAMDAGLRDAALQGEEYAASSMPGAGAGEVGTRRGRNVYRASNPGSPPGVRDGTLKRSVSSQRIGRLRWGYGTNLFYGRLLEYGFTTSGGQPFFKDKDGNVVYASRRSPHAARMAKTKPGRVAARPWLGRTLVTAKVAMERAFVLGSSREMARRATSG